MTRTLTTLLCLVFAFPALAQSEIQAFDLERLSFNPGGKHSLVQGTGEGLREGELRVSLAAQYQHNPLMLYVDGAREGAVVGSRLSAHFVAAVGINHWLEIGLQLPVILVQTGDDLTAHGVAPIGGAGLGSPVLQAQFTLLRQERGAPIALGLGLGVALPFGSAESLGRDPGVAVTPRIGAGRTFANTVRVGLEVAAILRQNEILSGYPQRVTDEVGSLITVGAVVGTVGKRVRGELNLRTLIPLTRTSAGFEVLAGLRYSMFAGAMELFVAAGPGFGKMPGVPDFRAIAGIAWTPSFKRSPAPSLPEISSK